ncbi:MAG: hypothetical protein Q9166_007151 [cf. Caloplaca sp. 2 TL-2023]
MALPQEPPLDEIQWKAPLIAQSYGGIQTNTGKAQRPAILQTVMTDPVLPYFYQSPFFDATSNNATITLQATHNPDLFYLIQTREAFEARLRTMQGLEFMVAHDPSDNGTRVDNSGVWVIRKQYRRKRPGVEDEVAAINSYYVIGENVYMAPSLGSILGARLLSTASSLNKIMATASGLPTFTPALGHTYLPPASKALTSAMSTQMSQTSKESTPIPGTQDSVSGKASLPSKPVPNLDLQSTQLLEASLNLSLRFGREYMDENPLVGEPGSFIISKTRDSQQLSQQPNPKPVSAATAKTPAPQVMTDIPPTAGKDSGGSDKSPMSPVTKEKKARRKSRPAGTPK